MIGAAAALSGVTRMTGVRWYCFLHIRIVHVLFMCVVVHTYMYTHMHMYMLHTRPCKVNLMFLVVESDQATRLFCVLFCFLGGFLLKI